MGKIILSDIAKYGEKEAKPYEENQSARSKQLQKEADERIRKDYIKIAETYIKAKSYIALY